MDFDIRSWTIDRLEGSGMRINPVGGEHGAAQVAVIGNSRTYSPDTFVTAQGISLSWPWIGAIVLLLFVIGYFGVKK